MQTHYIWGVPESSAYPHYEKTGDVDHAAAIGSSWIHMAEASDLCRRALGVVPPGTPESASILITLGFNLMWFSADGTEGKKMLQEALSVARKLNDDFLKMRIYFFLADAEWIHFHIRNCYEQCLKMIELPRSVNSPFIEVFSRSYAIEILQMWGRTEEMARQLQIIRGIAETSGERRVLWVFRMNSAFCAALRGEWKEAREDSDAALAIHPMALVLHQRALIEFETGNPTDGRRYAERLYALIHRKSEPLAATFSALLAAQIGLITGEAADADRAEEWARRVLDGIPPNPMSRNIAILALGLLALHKKNVKAAVEQRKVLRRWLKDVPSDEPTHARLEPYGEFFALCSRGERRLDEAIDQYQVTRNLNLSDRPRYAWLSFNLAETMLERKKGSDEKNAETLLVGALETANSLGMRPLRKRANEHLARIHAGSGRKYPDDLSRREVQVLRQLALGKTDQEIASELYISAKTVSNHVGRILRKTGTGNRTEAARYADKYGLADR